MPTLSTDAPPLLARRHDILYRMWGLNPTFDADTGTFLTEAGPGTPLRAVTMPALSAIKMRQALYQMDIRTPTIAYGGQALMRSWLFLGSTSRGDAKPNLHFDIDEVRGRYEVHMPERLLVRLPPPLDDTGQMWVEYPEARGIPPFVDLVEGIRAAFRREGEDRRWLLR